MFMLRNVSKYFFGDASKESIIDIPQGQLYLVRPLSPKGYSELLFRDSTASIRRTGQQHQYQLVVQRVYEEGEEELLAEDEDEDPEVAALNAEKDEKGFLLDESLHLRTNTRPGGEIVIAWRDLSGDPGDLYEFVCDATVTQNTVADFQRVAVDCQYERKYRKSHEQATNDELLEFSFEEQPIPDSGPPLTPVASNTQKERAIMVAKSVSREIAPKGKQTIAPTAAKNPKAEELMAEQTAELWLYDFESGNFIMQAPRVQATVSAIGKWNYWLQISDDSQDWLGQPVIADLNPVFNFEHQSLIFNHYTDDGSAYSWLLKFTELKPLEDFQEGLMQALWEHLNETKWMKVKEDERDYVLDAFNDLVLEDENAPAEFEEEEEEDDEDHDGLRSEHYDSDESQEDTDVKGKEKEVNSQLAVGYKHGRSFVVRGSKIGVFKHTPDNNLEFSTNISKVQTPKGKLFSPKKVMLHAEDTNMILQNSADPNSLYRMDLEYGKVVDEWKVHDDIPVTTFAPEKKYSQMTGEQTFLGLAHNALYRIDPRLAGTKLVESEMKQYAVSSKTDFSAAATTANGYIAVASNKGDIKMFDRLGVIAKTSLPALGDPIIGIDVSADGRWVLATTRTYLLLIDAEQKDGKHAGKLGFEKAFAKDSKPKPRRLGLTPSHVAQFQHETKVPISFTSARFNTGVDESETTIVTATGPFVVTWSMKKVLQGRKDPYSIKRYAEEVKADDFKYGSDKNLIVALSNEVGMVSKGQLRRPTRESIVGTPIRRSKGRASNLRNEVVDSPY